MNAKCTVGLTLGILGIIISLTIVGIVFSFIFLTPAIILMHLGLKEYKKNTNKSSNFIIVILTLSYITNLCSLGIIIALIGTESISHYREYKKENRIELAQVSQKKQITSKSKSPSHTLAIIWKADKTPLSKNDTEILMKIGECSDDWNRSLTPMVLQYLDPNVTGDDWLEQSSISMGKARNVLLRMETNYKLLNDKGARETLKPFIDVNKDLLHHYTRLQQAVIAGNSDIQPSIMKDLKDTVEIKNIHGLNIVKRTKAALGNEYPNAYLDDLLKSYVPM